jgi:hypothetical protein
MLAEKNQFQINLVARKLFENGETFITKLHKDANQVLICHNNCHWKIVEQDNVV